MTEIKSLFEEAKNITSYSLADMKLIAGEITGISFFPGGKGTFDESELISDKDYMMLGQDWGTYPEFIIDVEKGQENIRTNATWVNLLKLLKNEALNIDPNNCFFTNAILGVREKGKSTGMCSAFKSGADEFLKDCQDFFFKQVIMQRPKVIFVLGIYPALFLAPLNEELKRWKNIPNFRTIDEANNQILYDVEIVPNLFVNFVLLLHPSFRNVNLKRRKYKDLIIKDPEIEMIKDAIKSKK